MVTTTSKNCYSNHILFWCDVNLVKNFWKEGKIWNLVEAVVTKQWKELWKRGLYINLGTVAYLECFQNHEVFIP